MGNSPSCPAAPACPTAPSCPKCKSCPTTESCPENPVCPTCQEYPVCPSCQECPICPVCPVCPKTIDYIGLDIESDDSIIDILNNKKQVLLPSTNIPYNGLLNTPVSYISPLYGKPTYYYEAINPIVTVTAATAAVPATVLFNRITLVGATTLNSSYYSSIWHRRYMFGISGTTKTNTKPTNYMVLKLPIDPKTHNSIFIQTITLDRWSNITMYVCNNTTNVPVKKISTICNSARDGLGNSSYLGPMNSVAQTGHHEWLEFPLSIDTIDAYKTSNNEICVSINAGPENHDNLIWMTGVAVVPNNYAVTTVRATNLCWNSNSNVFTKQIDGSWLLEALNWHNTHGNEALVTLADSKVCKIHVPIISKDQDLIFGIITHNNTWYDTNPMIYVDDTLYYLSPLISGRYGFSLQGRGQHRYAKGIYIPKEVIKKLTTDSQGNKIMDSEGIEYIPIIIDQSKESIVLYIRGFYTEAVQAYIKP
jgi:hypothetical protein